jgi:hypothetical protein
MKTKPAAIMYHCDGCERPVRGVAGDAIHHTSKGKFCAECIHENAIKETRAAAERAETSAEGGSRRGDAARARWASMTPAQKAERVAKMQAGRATTRAT